MKYQVRRRQEGVDEFSAWRDFDPSPLLALLCDRVQSSFVAVHHPDGYIVQYRAIPEPDTSRQYTVTVKGDIDADTLRRFLEEATGPDEDEPRTWTVQDVEEMTS